MDTDEAEPPITARKILCMGIPLELLDKLVAKKHFRQFGRVLRIVIKPKSRSCIVEYDCVENAQLAVQNAGEYMGQVFEVNWYDKPKKKRVKKDPDPDWLPDTDIQDELQAMAATGDNGYHKTYSLRPEGMAVDVVPVKQMPKVKKTPKRAWKATTSKLKSKPKSGAKPNAWTPEQLELLNVLKQPAFTAEEKHKVLETRDKLIRLRTKKHTDLTKTAATVGTCPDMCPEKERLMREIQHQVALYEQDASGKGMNPAVAIKQYSRSSADQEAPLPHELRPVAVLQLTMGYLMHRILNLCDVPDVNLAEWFHFLWDRTRSIRKDITQQELCCQGSVALLEQCARFHIHCSARLVAEDPSVFDQKINTENLTKCLQTLKYMYHDLNLKGESCPNEAEFRAYIILLNLNDGNFMWEVQQLKLEIQKSLEVKFALEVYSAINKNNFVKFFKLVRVTGYLNACILLRYFVQVRTRALSTILKCYSPRLPYTQFPLHELTNLLAFEDAVSAVDFIVCYGLYLNPEETQVVLDRKSFQLPELSYALDRAVRIVESKRTHSVGEVVCGGPLPPPDFLNYKPMESFDQNGLLCITGVLADLIKDAEREPVSPIEDQPDSVTKVPSLPFIPVTTAANTFQKPPVSTSIFSTKIPSLLDNKVADPSQPFWSIKTEPKASGSIFQKQADSSLGIFTTPKTREEAPKALFNEPKLNIFTELKPTSIFAKSVIAEKTSIFSEPQKPGMFAEQKPNIFSEQPKLIFGDQKPAASIFGGTSLKEEQREPTVIPNIFGPGFKQPEAKSEVQKPFAIDDSKPSGFNIDKISSSVFGPRNQGPLQEAKLPFKAATLEPPDPLPKIRPPFVPVSRPPIKSPPSEQERAEKLKLEEQELQRQLQEKEEKLRREIEEMKKKAELKKQQLEEEKRRKEREKLERERQKRIEEEKRLAMIAERERKLAIEIKQTVTTLMDDLLTRVEELHKEERLKEIANNIKKHKATLFTQKWRRKIAINKRKRQAMDQNPIWLPSRTTNEEADELFTDTQSLTLQNIKRYKYGRSFEVPIPPKIQYEKIDVRGIYKILVNSYMKIYVRPQKEIFWKMTVSLPDFRELKAGLHLIEGALTDFFQWKDRYGNTAIVEQFKGDKSFSYCLEKKQGIHSADDSNGILFISHESTELLFQRISSSLKNFPNFARIPVAVILVNNDTSSINAQSLGQVLESDRRVTNYDILACKFTNGALINAVKQSLEFLAKFLERPPPLELDMLRSYLQKYLATELWKRISSYAIWNSKYKACLKSPNLVIALYNEAVEKLKAIALDTSSLEYPDFPVEFDKLLMDKTPEVLPCDYRYFPPFWKMDSYRSLVMNAVNSFTLPKFQDAWPPENEADLEHDIFAYCSQAFENPESVFYKVMAVILKNIDPIEDFEEVKNVLWIDIIEVLAMEKLTETSFGLNLTEFHSKSIFQQLFVVYDAKAVENYSTDEWFYLKNPLVEAEIRKNEVNKQLQEKDVMQVDLLEDFDLDELEKSIRADVDHQIVRKKSEIEQLENLMADLEESMEIHKKINANLQQTVKKALNVSK